MSCGNQRIYSAEFDSLDKPSVSVLSQRATHFLGSCNGLLCLTKGIMSGYYLGIWDSIDIFLFNPSTREYRNLPTHYYFDASGGHYKTVFGFGYDCVSDDYKVVHIFQCMDDDRHDGFAICSLKSNSWRRIMNFPYYVCCNAKNVFINGALHWVVTLERQTEGFVISDFNVDARIVSFDLATEEYRLVPQPEISDRNLLMEVGELGGRLCLHCISKGNYMNLWVLDHYGVKESWSKLLSVVQPVNIRKIKYLKAIKYSMDGQRVLFEQGGGKFFWYDLKLKRKRVKRVRIRFPILYKAGLCMGSLVKLTGAAQLQQM